MAFVMETIRISLLVSIVFLSRCDFIFSKSKSIEVWAVISMGLSHASVHQSSRSADWLGNAWMLWEHKYKNIVHASKGTQNWARDSEAFVRSVCLVS